LGRFEIVPSLSFAELKDRIDSTLERFVDFPADELSEKREQLCGLVLELSAHQETRMTPSEFFDRARLNTKSLANWKSVFQELAVLTESHIENRLHYQAGFDVRPAPDVLDPPATIVAGKSGQGKTWRLAAIGERHRSDGRLVCVTRASGTARATLQNAADFVWKTGFGRQREMSGICGIDRRACRSSGPQERCK